MCVWGGALSWLSPAVLRRRGLALRRGVCVIWWAREEEGTRTVERVWEEEGGRAGGRCGSATPLFPSGHSSFSLLSSPLTMPLILARASAVRMAGRPAAPHTPSLKPAVCRCVDEWPVRREKRTRAPRSRFLAPTPGPARASLTRSLALPPTRQLRPRRRRAGGWRREAD